MRRVAVVLLELGLKVLGGRADGSPRVPNDEDALRGRVDLGLGARGEEQGARGGCDDGAEDHVRV